MRLMRFVLDGTMPSINRLLDSCVVLVRLTGLKRWVEGGREWGSEGDGDDDREAEDDGEGVGEIVLRFNLDPGR